MLVQQTNRFSDLDKFEFLESDSFNNNPYLVPVLENNNTNFIDLESLIEYAEDTGSEDINIAIDEICYINNIDPSSVRFSVNEESIILNRELRVFVESLNKNGIDILLEDFKETDTSGFTYMHSKGVGDKAETVAKISDQMSNDIINILTDIKKMENTKENQDNLDAHKQNAEFMRHYEGGRAAMNRHFFNNKGNVQYHGDLLGPAGQSYGYNSDDVKFFKQAADKDPIDPETGKKVEGWQKYAFKGISKMAIKSMENEINNSEDRFNDIADRIKNEQIPRNIIAKLIAKFRGLYNKIMIKLKMGTYQREADAAYQKTANQILQDKKSGKYAKMGKFVFHTGKHTVLSYLRWVADKLLWFIDKLLQKLQNTANTAGDKIKSWLGNKSAQPQPNPA